ncbi:cation diffusion facilitator family transporter [Arhodomonas sp. SL1]|uniref:cation diffusion facilitator family transporter n=1 Tax=Arhodomonas sp. SL1 TaxID=3425691 RepID=UPI003F8822C8
MAQAHEHPGSGTRDRSSETREAHKVTLIGAVLDFTVGLAKAVIGWLVGSAALVADGIHSFSDVLTDAFVMAATHFGRREADANHPYGHGRIETMATLWLGSALIFVAGGIAWASISRLVSGAALPTPGVWGIGVAVAALLSKEWIYRYTLRVARRVDSRLLEANAWHSRSDALSTVVVLIGLIGAELGVGWLDAVAAIVVGVMVGQIGGRLLWESGQELVDTALPEAERERMRAIAEEVEGVRSVHELRSRTLGSDTVVDLHIVVPARVTVSEGHEIGTEVARRLREAFPTVTDVTFHIDPQDDTGENTPLQRALPLRQEVEQALEGCWASHPAWSARVALDLHYLDETIDIALYIRDLPPERDLDQAASDLREAAQGLDWMGELRLWQGPGKG